MSIITVLKRSLGPTLQDLLIRVALKSTGLLKWVKIIHWCKGCRFYTKEKILWDYCTSVYTLLKFPIWLSNSLWSKPNRVNRDLYFLDSLWRMQFQDKRVGCTAKECYYDLSSDYKWLINRIIALAEEHFSILKIYKIGISWWFWINWCRTHYCNSTDSAWNVA